MVWSTSSWCHTYHGWPKICCYLTVDLCDTTVLEARDVGCPHGGHCWRLDGITRQGTASTANAAVSRHIWLTSMKMMSLWWIYIICMGLYMFIHVYTCLYCSFIPVAFSGFVTMMILRFWSSQIRSAWSWFCRAWPPTHNRDFPHRRRPRFPLKFQAGSGHCFCQPLCSSRDDLFQHCGIQIEILRNIVDHTYVLLKDSDITTSLDDIVLIGDISPKRIWLQQTQGAPIMGTHMFAFRRLASHLGTRWMRIDEVKWTFFWMSFMFRIRDISRHAQDSITQSHKDL